MLVLITYLLFFILVFGVLDFYFVILLNIILMIEIIFLLWLLNLKFSGTSIIYFIFCILMLVLVYIFLKIFLGWGSSITCTSFLLFGEILCEFSILVTFLLEFIFYFIFILF